MRSPHLERPAFVGATPQFVFGVLIMVAGLALLLDRFGIVDASVLFKLWPLGMIAFGAMHFTRGAQQHRFWGLFWIFTGSWLLLRSLDIINVGFWELFIPVMLTAFGASLIMRTLYDSGHVKPDRARSPQLFSVFSDSKQTFDGQPFDGAYMTAFMGGCELDLRRAVVPPGEERTVEVLAVMGGHSIKVPQDWELVIKVVPIMGGVDDKRVPLAVPPVPGATPPRLIISGTVFMGGLELKN